MKRLTLGWMIGVMGAALLGLIGFQWYWIDTVIRANEERFQRDVMEALHSVAEKLEKQETLYTFQSAFPQSVFFPAIPQSINDQQIVFGNYFSGRIVER